MKKTSLKVFTLTLILFLLFPSVQPYAFATDSPMGNCGENLNWSFDSTNGTLTVSGRGDMENYSSSSSTPWKDIRNSITCVKIESGVTSVGDNAFLSCVNTESITIAESVMRIGLNAFSHCDKLTSVVIPEGVKSIESGAFIDCDMLSELTLFNGIESIGDYAFAYCPYLKSISIPDSTTDIGNGIFSYCVQLENVHFGKGTPVVDMTDFVECNNLKNINVHPENPNMTADENGVLFSKDKTTLLVYPANKEDTSFIIPYGVKDIGIGAFNFAVNLTKIDLPETLTAIGSNSFYACENLADIYIPDSVTEIGDLAFAGCESLTAISLPRSLKNIGYGVFTSCGKLESIFIPYCITKIENQTFSNCRSLADIYYNADKETWNKITIGYYNEPLSKAAFHFNHEHTHEKTSEKSPECEEYGYKKYSCTVCSHRYTEYIAETGHDFGEYVPDEDALSETATCRNNGCNKTLTREYKTTSSDKYDVSATYPPDSFDEEITLEVTEITDEREPGGIYMVEGKSYKQIGIFNIKAVNSSGETAQPNANCKVTLKIAIPEEYRNRTDMVIYHRFVDGGREKLSTADGTIKIENGYMIFEVSKFSEFELLLPVASAEITVLPNKTKYLYKSAALDLSGIELTVTHPDGTTEKVTDTSLMSVSGFNSSITGTQTVIVNYKECSAQLQVEVAYSWWQWIIRIILLGFLWY